MGCVLAKEASPSPSSASLGLPSRPREKNQPAGAASGRKSLASLPQVEAATDSLKEERDLPAEDGQQSRRRSRPDPRLSNPPGHVHGEQVAAGWPAWLSRAAGEAIKGWTPRRADAFEKIDKASFLLEQLLSLQFSSLCAKNAIFVLNRLGRGRIVMFTRRRTS